MKPILTYLKNFFASENILGKDKQLRGLVKVDSLLQSLIKNGKVPGLAISVLQKGATVFEKGYGFADVENSVIISPKETVFRIASVSKPIAAVALAKMVDEEKIDLDTSFYNYVSYYPKKKFDFTLRQLASHTAGIRGYRGKEYGLNKPYTIKDSIAVFKDDSLLFEPSKGYHYNSFDWVLISLAMQEVSGVPFEEYVAENVLRPLKMMDTLTPCLVERSRGLKNKNIAEFYTKRKLGFKVAMEVNNFYKLAGGGFLSTVQDIGKLGQAVLDRNKAIPPNMSTFLTAETINGTSTYYGLGWQVSQDKNGNDYYGHIGNSIGAYSNFFVYPKEELVITILINCTDPKVQEVLDEVVGLLLEEVTNKTN